MHNTLVIYHSADFDGICSLAIAREFLGTDKNVVYHGINYGGTLPEHLLHKQCVVYMCDFSLQPWPAMIDMARKCKKVYFIDHHKTALDGFTSTADESTEAGIVNVNSVCDTRLGACAYVWQYFFEGLPLPLGVRLLAEYDVWNHSDPLCLPFQYGLRLHTTRVVDDPVFSQKLLGLGDEGERFVHDIAAEGSVVLRYNEQQFAESHKYMFTLNFEGVKFLAFNGHGNSLTFDDHPKRGEHDACLLFRYNGVHGSWAVSMYSSTVDLSPIAVKHGGGGHKGACGFSTKKLPFKLSE